MTVQLKRNLMRRPGAAVVAAVLAAALAALAAPAAAELPRIETWQEPGGPRVLFVEAHEIPIIDIRFVFLAGAARDGAQPGLARLTNQMLREGAGELDAKAFNEQLAATGASLETSALRDMAYIGMRTLSDEKYRKPALELLELAITAPRFDEQALARRKNRALVRIQRRQQRPAQIAEEVFYKSLYGSHPYADPPGGTTESVEALARDDIARFFDRYYVAANAVVAIIGDVDRAEAEAMVARITKGMARGERAPALPDIAPLDEPRTEYVEYDSLQTHVRVGQPGVVRGDPDYFPLLVGNHVLGGSSLVSKLFQEVREKRGLSYSVYSSFAPMAKPGPFVAALQTGRAQTDEALAVLNETVAAFVAEGPTEEELEAAKKNLIGGFPLRVMSNADVLEYLAVIGAYDLPLSYLSDFRENIARVTVEDVREAFARRVSPERFLTVVVGGRAAAPAPGSEG